MQRGPVYYVINAFPLRTAERYCNEQMVLWLPRTGITGSNPAGGIDVFPLFCVGYWMDLQSIRLRWLRKTVNTSK